MALVKLGPVWSNLMAKYQADHQNKINQVCHSIGIPMIAASVPLAATVIGLPLAVPLFALGWTFPYDRLGDRVIAMLSEKYDVTIADVHGTFLPGGVVFESVVLKTRPTQPDDKPVALVFSEIRLGGDRR